MPYLHPLLPAASKCLPLVLTSMTLKGVIALIFSPNYMALQAYYVAVVADKPIMSHLHSTTFGQK